MCSKIRLLNVGLPLVLLAAFGLPGVVFAQSPGSIAGVVEDTSGLPLPGVTVETTSPALIEGSRTTVTDSQGAYRFVDLRPGAYAVTFTIPGFSTVRREALTINSGVTASVNAELSVGAIQETITVTGENPVVDLQNVTQHQTMTREIVESLPTGRKWADFAVLIPGVVTTRGTKPFAQDVGGSAGDTNPGLGIHGSNPREMVMILDGMRYGNIFGIGGQFAGATTLNSGMIEEISIDTSGVSAESESGGVRANIIPRQGGNLFTGEMFANYMNQHMQSDNLDDEQTAAGVTPFVIEKIWDTNASFGGPIKRERMWFFFSARSYGTDEQPPGAAFDTDPFDFAFTPDPDRRPLNQPRTINGTLRVTTKLSDRSTLAILADYSDRCAACDTLSSTTSFEASRHHQVKNRMLQGTWSMALSSRVLFELGHTFMYNFYNYPRQDVTPVDLIGIQDLGLGISYRAPRNEAGQNSRQHNGKTALTYVSGAHNLKFGAQWFYGFGEPFNFSNPVFYRLRNGVPDSLLLRASPTESRRDQNSNFGMYVQEQWTRDRVTLNAGLRFDYLHISIPAQQRPETRFTPAVPIDLIDNVPLWKDISPRIGLAYDIFGTGRTALKWNLGRFVELQATGFAGAVDPTSANQTTTRAWNDVNSDFNPDCDLFNTAANGECGPNSNQNFGTPAVSVAYDPETVTGWGSRGYNWETMVGIQHEVRPNLGIETSYHRRWFGNFRTRQNLLTSPSDYDPFCVNVPVDPRLGAVSGQEFCGLYDITPALFGVNDTVITGVGNFGDQSQVYDGVDYLFNTRLGGGIILQGGGSTGRVRTNDCVVVNTPQDLLQCDISLPFQTQFKFSAIYPVPFWDLQLSGSYQSIPGVEVAGSSRGSAPAANWSAPASAVTGLGRPLAGGRRSVTVPLIAPGEMFNDRIQQIDLRVAKNFFVGGTRLQGHIDLYNLLNANPVLGANNRYGSAWLRPVAILSGRIIKVGARLSF